MPPSSASLVAESAVPSRFNARLDEQGLPQRVLSDFVVLRGGKRTSICELDDPSAPRLGPMRATGRLRAADDSEETIWTETADLTEWCVEYSAVPVLWVRTAETWYHLDSAASEYASVHTLARRRFEVCARLYILMTQMAPAEATFAYFSSLLSAPWGEMRGYSEKEILMERKFILAQFDDLNEKHVNESIFLKELRAKKSPVLKSSSSGGTGSSNGGGGSSGLTSKGGGSTPKGGGSTSKGGGSTSKGGGSASKGGGSSSKGGGSSSKGGGSSKEDGLIGKEGKASGTKTSKKKSSAGASGSLPPTKPSGPWVPRTDLDQVASSKLLTRMSKVLSAVMKMKKAVPFLAPVDPVAHGCHDYLDRIEHPMDYGTIWNRHKKGAYYKRVDEIVADVRLIKTNCITYNGKDHPFSKYADEVEKKFDKEARAAEEAEWKTMQKRVAASSSKKSGDADSSLDGAIGPTGRKPPKSNGSSSPGGSETEVVDCISTASGSLCGKRARAGSRYCGDDCGMAVARKKLALLRKEGMDIDDYIRNCLGKSLVGINPLNR